MMNNANETPATPSGEVYTGAGSEAVLRHMASRTADKEGAFFLPHLRSGMALLDCGCGLGTITLGLARAVAPGQVVGIDIDASQIARAQTLAAEQKVTNVRYESASIYALPFADNSFEAAFSHAVIAHLVDPSAALREIHRVLKVGGVVGLRNSGGGAGIRVPIEPLLERGGEILGALFRRNGANPSFGDHQSALLRQVGFVNIQMSASFDSFGTPERRALWANTVAGFFREEKGSSQILEYGLSDRAELERICHAWDEWAEDPDAFAANPSIEVVGWKA